MGYVESVSGVAARACEWLGEWIKHTAPPWTGPPEVNVYARMLVIALRDGEPIDFVAPEGERYRLRIAPGEVPPVALHAERDDGRVTVARVVYVPASLRLRKVEGER